VEAFTIEGAVPISMFEQNTKAAKLQRAKFLRRQVLRSLVFTQVANLRVIAGAPAIQGMKDVTNQALIEAHRASLSRKRLRCLNEGIAGQTAVDEQLAPQVIAEQRVKKPVGPSQSSCLGIGVDEVIMSDLFHPGAQLSTGRHPVKDRLTEAKLEAVS